MIELRRHSDGSPMDGVDVVPDGDRSVRLREQLASVMALLQAANDRNANLLTNVSRWKRDYANVRDELLALKYRRLCTACQLQRLSRHQSIGQDCQDPRHRLQSLKESQRQVGCG